jgi:hypothetical protein
LNELRLYEAPGSHPWRYHELANSYYLESGDARRPSVPQARTPAA